MPRRRVHRPPRRNRCRRPPTPSRCRPGQRTPETQKWKEAPPRRHRIPSFRESFTRCAVTMHFILTVHAERTQRNGTEFHPRPSHSKLSLVFFSALSAVRTVKILFSREDFLPAKTNHLDGACCHSRSVISQRDYGIEPRVARNELPWEREIKRGYPERVGSKNECRRAISNCGSRVRTAFDATLSELES